jgi:hypothetical protein
MTSREPSRNASHLLRCAVVWAGFLALVAMALFLVSPRVDWTRTFAGLDVDFVYFLPLLMVGGAAAVRAHRLSRALALVDGEWIRVHEADRTLLPRLAGEIQHARAAALERPDAFIAPPSEGGGGTPARLVSEAFHLFVAGEHVRLAHLQDVAVNHDLDRTAPLVSAAHTALGLGLLGTLAGILVQFWLARQMGVVSLVEDGLLAGTLLAVTTTAQGVLTAAYARGLRSHLLRLMDAQLDDILRLLALGLLPALGDERTRPALEIAQILRSATDRMEQRFVELGTNIAGIVARAVQGLPAAVLGSVGDLLRDSLCTPLGRSVAELREGIGSAIADLRQAADRSTDVLASSGRALERAARALETQIDTAVRTPGDLTRALQEARHELSHVADSFRAITDELREAGATLRRSDDELLARAHEHVAMAEELKVRADVNGARLDAAAARLEESVHHLGAVVRTIVEASLPRIGDPPAPSPPRGRLFGRLRSPRGNGSD